MVLFRAFFLMLETIVEIRENQFFLKNTFSCQWKPFSLFFLPEEAVFSYRGNVFFNECFIPGNGNGSSGQYKPFFIFPLLEKVSFSVQWNVFLNESFIPAIGEGFLSLMETVTLFESFFLPVEIAMSGNQFLKTELILVVETDFLASGNHFLPLSHIFFKESFIPISGNAFFSPKEQYCFLFRAFFPTIENHYLNYREAYSKPLLLLSATIFFDFLDISVNGSSFFV